MNEHTKELAFFPLLQADADRIENAVDQFCVHILQARESRAYRVNREQTKRMEQRLKHALEMIGTL